MGRKKKSKKKTKRTKRTTKPKEKPTLKYAINGFGQRVVVNERLLELERINRKIEEEYRESQRKKRTEHDGDNLYCYSFSTLPL